MPARNHKQWVATPPVEYVDSRIYSDPDIFEDELELIFKRTWVPVCHESELPEPYDFRTMSIAREPVIVARGPDNQVRAFLNVCPHRGMMIERIPSGHCERARGPVPLPVARVHRAATQPVTEAPVIRLVTEQRIVVTVGPHGGIGLIGVGVAAQDDFAADQSVEAILDTITGEITCTPHTAADGQSPETVVVPGIDESVAERRGELIDPRGSGRPRQRQDAVIERRDPALIERRAQHQLLRAEIVRRAAAAQEVVAEVEFELAVDRRR